MYSLKDAIEDGYKPYELRTQKGYCTRKHQTLDEIEVHFAEGNRKGEPYYLAPCFFSTRYCYRMYLKKEEQDYD